ncbi:phage tail protein [Bacillus sp. 7586-K]|nr:phage tail protein [Bacillus sp. 7586-K]
MAYEHGITILENETSITPPVPTTSGVQVVIGTAPIHLLEDPRSAVNTPILANTLTEVKQKIGYNHNFDYSLNEATYASFEFLRVAPVVYINVLDPDVHKKSVPNTELPIESGILVIKDEGVLLDSVVVRSIDATTIYEENVDYTVAINSSGYPVISILSSGTIPVATTTLSVGYDKLDPSKVTEADIIGGYNAQTGKLTGAELIQQVFPMFGVTPGLILAPGWSKYPDVASILVAKSTSINGNFNCTAILDIDTTVVKKYEDAPEWKTDNNYSSTRAIVCYPMVKVTSRILSYSAVVAAQIALLDAENDNVPYVSPSNKKISIAATVLEDGTEIYLDQTQANFLNGHGILTAINWNGWRTWGNNTAAYPNTADPKDRFIAVRRVFDWWGNTFILTFFDQVDDPTNYRLIESIVDSENLRASGYQARGQIAGASIEFRQDLNPTENILNGKITFIQKIGAFTPAESIVNILEFDPTILTTALTGGQ